LRRKVHRALCAAALLSSGCTWKIEEGGGWLPLLGEPGSGFTHKANFSSTFALEYEAPDGRIWLAEALFQQGASEWSLRSFEAESQTRTFPAVNTQLTRDGVLSISAPDEASPTHLRIELDPLTSAPKVVHDIELPTGSDVSQVGTLGVWRGPGYIAYANHPGSSAAGEPTSERAVYILFDDGRTDEFRVEDAEWMPICGGRFSLPPPPEPAQPRAAAQAPVSCSARYLILQGRRKEPLLGVYDLDLHLFRELPIGDDSQASLGDFHPSAEPQFDVTHEGVWICRSRTLHLSLATGEVQTFPFSCVDLWAMDGQEVLAQASDGRLFALEATGAMTALGSVEPHALRAVHDRTFVYTKSGADNYAADSFGGWLGERQIVRAGRNLRFSSDGAKLFWLEDVTSNAGDLYSLELATMKTEHLVRNVAHFEQLPDGRLVAIAHAAYKGAWNRGIVVDAAQRESRWLLENVQALAVIGDSVLMERRTGDLYEILIRP
jgi:hypothetical protein